MRPNQDGRSGWPRLLRLETSVNSTIHGMKLVDAPSFHLVVGNAANAGIYRITFRGGNQGGLDGVDMISGTNYHVHHVEVTNRDECACIKSPLKQATIEKIRCNQSGGPSIASLKDGSVIEYILFQNVENYRVTNAFMLETFPGGASPGYVKNIVLRNFTNTDVTWYGATEISDAFIPLHNAYITQYWQNSYVAGVSNVQLSTSLSPTGEVVDLRRRIVHQIPSGKRNPTKYETGSVAATAAPAGWVKPSAPWGIPPIDLFALIPVPSSTFYLADVSSHSGCDRGFD